MSTKVRYTFERALLTLEDANAKRSNELSRPSRELATATAEFTTNYRQFAENHKRFVLLDDDLQAAFQNDKVGKDVKQAAQFFQGRLRATVQAVEQKHKSVEMKGTTKVTSFLSKLYPVAKLSLSFTVAIADVKFLFIILTCRERHFLL
jgi:transcriptional regulator NrdR family protein